MRDGVHLATDLSLPAASGRFPVLVNRTPYGKDGGVTRGSVARARRWVERGYAVLLQACRGNGHLEGEYHYDLDDANDGHDTVAWAAAQPWSSGRAGVFGASYGATAGYLLAAARPPGLAAMVMMLGASNNYLDGRWRGGLGHAAHGATCLDRRFGSGGVAPIRRAGYAMRGRRTVPRGHRCAVS